MVMLRRSRSKAMAKECEAAKMMEMEAAKIGERKMVERSPKLIVTPPPVESLTQRNDSILDIILRDYDEANFEDDDHLTLDSSPTLRENIAVVPDLRKYADVSDTEDRTNQTLPEDVVVTCAIVNSTSHQGTIHVSSTHATTVSTYAKVTDFRTYRRRPAISVSQLKKNHGVSSESGVLAGRTRNLQFFTDLTAYVGHSSICLMTLVTCWAISKQKNLICFDNQAEKDPIHTVRKSIREITLFGLRS